MKRHAFLYSVLLAGTAGSALVNGALVNAAHADTLITGSVASPAMTQADGNITLSGGSVLSVAVSGAAVTLNSNNSIENGGNIENTFANGGAVGVHIIGGNQGDYTQDANGFVNVTGAGAANYGILVDGSSPYIGNISLASGAVIVTHGNGGTAIGINAPVTGNVTIAGGINGFDQGAQGLIIKAPVTGTVSTAGVVFLAGYPDPSQFSTSVVDPTTGTAVALGASVSGGYLNAGPVDTSDVITTAAALQSSGTAPTLNIAPSIAGASASDIVIGYLAGDTTNPSFSVVNRGTIINKENDPGISTVAVAIGETAAGAPAHTVTLTGGLFNRGTISATAETDNFNATKVAAASANATALNIGNGATLLNGGARAGTATAGDGQSITLDANASSTNEFYKGLIIDVGDQDRLITDYKGDTKVATIAAFNGSNSDWDVVPGNGSAFTIKSAALRNDGSILALVTGTETGNATSVLIQPQANVTSFINTGTVKAEAYSFKSTTSNLAAYGVRDQSGTLNDITNYGSILALAGYNPTGAVAVPLDDNSQKTIGVDISASSAKQTINDYGQITGDVYFGSAGMNGSVAGNQLVIEGSSAGVSGAVHAANNGTLDIHVSEQESGGTFLTYNTQATSLNVGRNGQVVFLMTKAGASQTTITTTGDVTFREGSAISILPGSFLADGTYTLVKSGTAIHYEDIAGTTNITVPYLFNAVLSTDANPTVVDDGQTLKMTLTRKSTTELGLVGNSAAIYDSLSAAALHDDSYGAALMSLTNADQVQTALNSAVPDVAGGVRALAVSMTDEATGVIGTRQRSLLTAPAGSREEFRFWGQEFYNNLQQDPSTNQSGFSGAGQGLSLGAEWGKFNTGRYGVGLTFFSSQETEQHPRDTKTDGDWLMASVYAAWRANNFFVAPQLNVGGGDMQSRRTVLAGGITRIATGSWQSQMAAGGFTSGYIIDFGNFQIIPTLAIDAMYLREGSYNEANAGGLGVTLQSQNQKSVRGFAGVIGQGSYNYDQGVLMPQLMAGYSREFLNDPSTIDGYFEAAPGSPFHLTGPQLEASHLVGGVSFGYVLRNWSAGVNYDASANSGSLAQSATLSLSSRF